MKKRLVKPDSHLHNADWTKSKQLDLQSVEDVFAILGINNSSSIKERQAAFDELLTHGTHTARLLAEQPLLLDALGIRAPAQPAPPTAPAEDDEGTDTPPTGNAPQRGAERVTPPHARFTINDKDD